MVRTIPRPIYSRKRIPVPILQELGGLQGRSGRGWKTKYSFNLLGLETLTVHPLANDYTDYSGRLE